MPTEVPVGFMQSVYHFVPF